MSFKSSAAPIPQGAAAIPQGRAGAMALSALGVVFGDIGTSPLYTLKTVLGASGRTGADRAAALGSLSLIVWTLIIITTIKYVSVAMRVDNHGEGGIMALMALLGGGRKKKRAVIIAVGLFGAALIYGDGAITPAISVLVRAGRAFDPDRRLRPLHRADDRRHPRPALSCSAARDRADRQDVRTHHGGLVPGRSACSAFGVLRKIRPCLWR